MTVQTNMARVAAPPHDDTHRTIIDAVPVLIAYIDRNYRYVEANQTYTHWFKKDRASIVGKHVKEVLGEEAWKEVRPYMDKALAGEQVKYEERLHYQIGAKWVEVTYIPERNPAGKVLGFVVHVHDVERRRTSEERYRTLFNTIDEGFCVIEVIFDAQGEACDYRFIEVNPAFEKQTGLRDAAGKTMRSLAPQHETYWFEIYAEVAKTGRPSRFIKEAKALNRWYDVYAFRLNDNGSHKVAVLFNDITERQRSIHERERFLDELKMVDQRKNEFLATLSHELRNPLAPISNGLHLIKHASEKKDWQMITQVHGMMDRQLAQLIHLVNDLLDVSRVNSGKIELQKQRVDLRDAVNAALESSKPLIESAKHKMELRMPDQPLWVHADSLRLAQVISNLLNNAAKYTPAGGTISLAVQRSGDQVIITVTDTGIGIPQHMLSQIFDLFTQVGGSSDLAQGGLGIGLNLVKRLTEKHEGSVKAESDGEGHGSRFTVTLPLDKPQDA